jgi:AcrR family transcriptional regulator
VTPQGQRRQEILRAATERFGRDGYEDTRWAHIAADVGVGATALYHYFESKQHCLYDESGERIGTFLAVAQLDDTGRMRRYMVARSPAMAFEEAPADA